MQKFTIEVVRTDYFTIEVEGSDLADAEETALEIICHSADPENEFLSHSSGFDLA